VGFATFGVLDILNAALLGAAAMLITRCCSAQQAQNSLDMNVIVTIGASFALGSALDKTGVAAFLAHHVIALSGGDAWLILILTYVTVMVLTEFITNNAAAILTVPIALQVTGEAGLNVQPYLFAIMMAASASFATPIGYQTNLMVYGPGGYRFSDFLRIGIPMNLFVGIASILAIGVLLPLD
jgi:di/tricarboxylate transporter